MAKTPKKVHKTTAIHIENGDIHLIGLKGLRVVLMPDSGAWFAQGLEIDYAAAGSTIDEAKDNFGEGLAMTIREHLVMHGNIEKLLKVASPEVWKEAFQSEEITSAKYSTVQLHELGLTEEETEKTPFSNIVFVEPQSVAA